MFTVIGAPLDSSGSGRGESRAPEALRQAGLARRLGGRDLGNVAPPITDSTRDPETGVTGVAELREASLALAGAVAETLVRDERLLVLGGACSVLLGVFVALRRAGREPGLWFVDGHADFYDGHSSPSGEAADMGLAMLTGHGPEGLIDLGGAPPLVAPERVIILGHRRPEDHEDVAEELAYVPAAVERLDAGAIEELGPGEVGRDVEARLAASGPAWLHLDLDVLDGRSCRRSPTPSPAAWRGTA